MASKMSAILSSLAVIMCGVGVCGLLSGTEGQNQLQENNFFLLHDDCLSLLNKQVNLELYASLVYMNIAAHFKKPSVGLYGVAKFFKDQSKEEYEHAQTIIDYINKRDGTLKRLVVEEVTKNSWSSYSEALKDAIKLEKHVSSNLQYINDVAEQKCQDAHLSDFIVTKFLTEQMESISQLTEMLSKVDVKETSAASTREYFEDQNLRKEL